MVLAVVMVVHVEGQEWGCKAGVERAHLEEDEVLGAGIFEHIPRRPPACAACTSKGNAPWPSYMYCSRRASVGR